MRWLILTLCFVLACSCRATGIREGMTRLEVEAALGKPIAALARGEQTVLTYPKGGRVVLQGGRVVEMVSVELAPLEPSAPPSAPAQTQAPVIAAETAVAPKASPAQAPKAAPSETEEPETAAPEFPTSLEGFGTPEPPERAAPFWLMLVVAAGIRVGIVMVVLKLAFRWADVHADWGQMFLPALADTLVRSAFSLLGHLVWNVDNWFYVDEAASYFALLYVLLKATHACTLSRAVAVAGAAKLMSIVVGAAVAVFLMQLFA